MFQRIALVISLILLSSAAKAANPKDVQEVAAYMLGTKKNAKGVKPEFKKDWAGAETSPVYRVVFVADGRRYTLQYSSAVGDVSPVSIGFWERPDGTFGQDTVDWYDDENLDGEVNVGNGPKHNLYSSSGGKVEGVENKAHWQAAYDKAIAAALKYFRNK